MAVTYIDPVAQTFFVDETKYPKGLFVHSVDLVFKKKDDTTGFPFTIQLRPTINGYPHSSMIHSGAAIGEVSLSAAKIKTVSGIGEDLPDISNPDHYTRFTFAAPVYLLPGEHALVLFSSSDDYQIYIAEIGGERLDGTEKRVDKQVYAGSFFKSQNGSTYTAYQDIDLMFRINICKFNPGTTSVILENKPESSNVIYDLLNLNSQELVFKDTSTEYYYKVTDSITNTLDSDYTNVVLNEDQELPSRKIVYNNDTKSLIVKIDLATTDNTVSSMIDTERVWAVAVTNIVNDCELKENNFTITNGGTGYTANATVTITANAGSGFSGTAVANTVSQKIERIDVTNSGSGYTENVSITIAAPTVPSGNTTATASVASETNPKGGPALARYITRKVTLADGFDANIIRVYLTAYQPTTSTIEVYYKVLADEDPENFEDKPYVRMLNVQQGNEKLLNTVKSNIKSDFFEYLFVPPTSEITYTSAGVNYTTFKTFAIKIVLRSSNISNPPIVRDLRAIALAP